MKSALHAFPLVKLPYSIDKILYLIREELKSQKFFSSLQKCGIDDCYYQPQLGRLILQEMGLDDGSDEIFNTYCDIIEKRLKKVEPDGKTLMKQAMKVYVELVKLREL